MYLGLFLNLLHWPSASGPRSHTNSRDFLPVDYWLDARISSWSTATAAAEASLMAAHSFFAFTAHIVSLTYVIRLPYSYRTICVLDTSHSLVPQPSSFSQIHLHLNFVLMCSCECHFFCISVSLWASQPNGFPLFWNCRCSIFELPCHLQLIYKHSTTRQTRNIAPHIF